MELKFGGGGGGCMGLLFMVSRVFSFNISGAYIYYFSSKINFLRHQFCVNSCEYYLNSLQMDGFFVLSI